MDQKSRQKAKRASVLIGWAPALILILTISGTIIAWQQAVHGVEAETEAAFDAEVVEITTAINNRMDAYSATLQGFRGLFHSSDTVNEKEFHDYFDALDLRQTHPGFKTINFITRVTPATMDAFLARVRADRSLNPEGNPDFAIHPGGDRPEYFIATYTGVPEVAIPQGTDLRENEQRRALLEKAQKGGMPTASTSVQLLGPNGQPTGEQGFVMTIPIYRDSVPAIPEGRIAETEGFVNINFAYQSLLKDTLDHIPPAVAITIYDKGTKKSGPVYQQGKTGSADSRTTTHTLSVAGQKWLLEIEASRLFGLTQSTKAIPTLVLAGGITVSVALVFIFWLLSRSRARALRLASQMTVDLQAERNAALAAKIKDEAILTSIGDGVFALDIRGNIILFNKAAADLSGYTVTEALGQPFDTILRFRKADGKTPSETFIAVAQSGKRTEMSRHTFLVQKNGTLLPVADSAAPIYDAEGKQLGIIVVFRDITAEARFQQVLEDSNERFRLASQATNDVVYDLDLVGEKLRWNDALYEAYGYNKTDVDDSLEWWTSHIHPDDTIRLTGTLDKLTDKTVDHWTVEYRFQKADDTYIYVRDRAFIQRSPQGQPIRLIGSMLDITQQKQLDQAKDEFVSLVSHQLRTPLTAIRLFVEMLSQGQVGELNSQQKDYLSKVQISTGRMIRLVGDILNVSRIELGRVKIDPVPTDMQTLIQSHIDEVRPLADSKKVVISFTPPAAPLQANVDPTIFGQVIHNLLTNAIRYTTADDGKVEVSFREETDGYLLTVQDNGIGIPEAARPRIFERFFRADNAVKTEGEGTGLGLYLIKMIMDTAGGSLRFESREGEGTTFYAQLPPGGMKPKRGEKTLS